MSQKPVFLLVAALAVTSTTARGATPSSPAPHALSPAQAQALLTKYCVTCHNDRAKTAGLTLQSVDLTDAAANANRLEKVVRKLRAASMPPAGVPRPERATYKALTTFLEGELDTGATAHPNAGRTEALHRLNRAEYQNAVRDLLDLEGVDIALMLPSDDASYGFDNIAGVLGMSPTHLERYLAAAHKISRIAVGDVTMPPYGETQVLPSDLSQDNGFETLPLGTRGGTLVRRYFPVDGEYSIKFQSVAGVGTADKEPNFLEVTIDGERVFYERVVQNVAKALDDQSSTDYEIHVPVKGGLRAVAVTYVQATSAQLEDYLQPYQRPPGVSSFKLARMGGYAGPYVSVIGFTGPLNPSGPGDTPSRQRVFVCHPASAADEAPCARRILSTLARRAYRRPVTDADVKLLLDFYRDGRTRGGFDTGIAVALERVLTSPDFLFRVERDPVESRTGIAYAVDDLDLASRLSFFLWSSIPDDVLLDLASRGRLHEPAILDAQVRRMLTDQRSDAFVSNFAGQWLRLRNIKNQSPDSRMFPNFDDNLRLAFRRETELFFTSIVQGDRSALDLISANYTFLNERLARHYGIPNIYGSNFRRVSLVDERRGGLLGQGSVLLVTSQANRTSPVTRGKWILENLLGAPPPAPPPNVPALEATRVKGTLRQQMEAHRKNPVCASCHKLMDPLGFALENYDPVGTWRTADGADPVDAEGAMPDGTTFQGVAGLKRALLADPSVFVNALTEKLMIYALGRGLEYYDAPAVRKIVRDATTHQYRFSSLVLGIVNSVPFRMRMPDPGRGQVAITATR